MTDDFDIYDPPGLRSITADTEEDDAPVAGGPRLGALKKAKRRATDPEAAETGGLKLLPLIML